ncbi:MAG: VWA domain-containing protein [Chitinispirillaceae bacterium]|nr:VWA domain-containing protein [Chitinispirillaceae bacterium]
MNSPFKSGILLLTSLLLFSMTAGVSGQVDQTIYFQYCVAQPDTSCFEPNEGALDSVGRDVAALGGTFRFCLQLDTIDSGYAPIRVIMVLDESGSMCENSNQCCTEGDGTNNCMLNDPTNQRVAAAHLFVDSLRAKSPESQVGIVIYAQNAETHNPLPLNSDNNVSQIHDWIDGAACQDRGIGKTTKSLATYLGLGLQTGLRIADFNFDQMDPFMTRHVILLTDGAWDDLDIRHPDSVVSAYIRTNPGRAVPAVHGVFLSNVALHVEHGYPPEGCSTTDPVDLSYLEYTSKVLTGGMYFPGSTPENIVSNFQTLLDSMTRTVPQQLVELIVTNNTNGEVSSSRTITRVGSDAVWESTLDNLTLVEGPNNLEVRQRIYSPSLGDTIVKTTNVIIVRSTLYRETLDTDLFKEYCELVSARLTITVTPEIRLQNEKFDVKATISNAQNFKLDTTQLRIFTRFPDNENGVLATFHLDGDLTNATGGTGATGSPTFTTSAQLFGSGAITSGNFSYSLAQLGGDFVIEEWVNPGRNEAAVLFSGSGYEIGVDNEMKLYFKSDNSVIVSALVPLDDAAWSHIAVVRTSGKVQLFINGIAVSDEASFSTAIAAGAITVSVPNRWSVDEIRFSNRSRVSTQAGTRTLAIPTISNITWTLADVESKGEVLTVPPTSWVDAQLNLQFSSPVSGRILVNMRQKSAGSIASGWSKNSNPVRIADDLEGPYVKKGTLTPAAIGKPYDTLLLEFNEPITCDELTATTPDRVFTVSNEQSIDQNAALNGSEYLESNPCSGDFISSIKILVPTGQITPEEDSIRIVRTTITDAAGNAAQTDKKGEIVWGAGADLEITAIPNEPGRDLEIDDNVKNNLNIPEDYGKVVRVIARRDLKAMDFNTTRRDSVYGKAMIYDPVGNLIQTDLDVFESSRRPRNYYFVWNGTNRTGRRVASGPYLVVFKFQFPDGTPMIEKKKLALRW